MDTGNYHYSQYQSTAEYDNRMNSFSSGPQHQSQSMMSQQLVMYPQQAGMMSQQTDMGQQSSTMSQQSGMSQQWGAMSHQTSVMPQQSGTMSQQSGMAQQSGTMYQQSGVSQQSSMSATPNSTDMHQSSNMWIPPPPPSNTAHMSGSANMSGSDRYMSGSSTTNYSTNQQRSTGIGSQYQQGTGANSTNRYNQGYQQQNRTSYQQNTRNTTGMNDQLDDFYTEIGNTGDTNSNYQQQYNPRSNTSQSQSSRGFSAQGSSNMQHNRGQKPVPQVPHEASNEMGTWRSAIDGAGTGMGTWHNKKSDFADEDTEYCKLCNVYFTSAPMYAFHVRGLAHAQRLMAVEAGKDRKPATQPYIVSGKNYTQTAPQEPINGGRSQQGGTQELNAGCYCEICDIYVNTDRMLWRHYQGKKHIKNLNAVERGELQIKPRTQWPVDPNIEKAAKLAGTRIPDDEVSELNFAFDDVPDDEPIVGLGFLVEMLENTNQVIECELCRTKGNLYNMVQHVLGLKHRLQYLKIRDRDRYDTINKSNKKPILSEETRLVCLEVERIEGRGTARYAGPPRRIAKEHERRLHEIGSSGTPGQLQQIVMTDSEKRVAIEALKRTLLEDFAKRDIDPDTTTTILNSRMELLAEYEKRGVPFAVARERVIAEEERWNLLLEFERQVLSFEEAEERIDHRHELMKMYEQNGFPREEATRKVLDDEVIYDFRRDFVKLGLQREQAQRLSERRLWMLEHLHCQGISPTEASEKVIVIERELKRFLRAMFEEDRKGRVRDSRSSQWMAAGEDLEKFIVQSCRELGLDADQTDDQISQALEAFDRYRRGRIPPDEAKCRVLVDDLPIPRQPAEKYPISMEEGSASEPGSKADITNRVEQFKSKMNAVIQTAAEDSSGEKSANQTEAEVDREKLMADYDKQSRLEIQNLLSDMLKMKVPADEARKRLVALYKQHEHLRESFFPAKKMLDSSGTTKKSSASEETKKEEKMSTEVLPGEKETSKNVSSAEEMTVDSSGKDGEDTAEKGHGKATPSEKPTEENPECPKENVSSEMKTTANDRWNASVEMFLKQYGLSREEYEAQMSRRRIGGNDRYSPSDLSPRRSKSPDGNRRLKSRWSQMLNSRLQSRSPSGHHRRSASLSRRGRERSHERDLDPRGPRRSPSRRSPRPRSPLRRSPPRGLSPFSRSQRSRFSPGRRSPRPGRFSPDRRSPPRRRSPYGYGSPGRRASLSRRSPGRRSPGHSRGHSPGRRGPTPLRSWGRPAEFSDRERPRWSRNKTSESDFNFNDGVWPDVDDPWD